MTDLHQLPIPACEVNRDGRITALSPAAVELFGGPETMHHLSDESSQKKLLKLMEHGGAQELALFTTNKMLEPITVFMQWEQETAIAQFIPVNKSIARLEQLVLQQQHRLMETDFQLMERKEAAEQAYAQLKRQSASVIALSEHVGLVPLFGDLDEDLLIHTSEPILHAVHSRSFDVVYIDFTAIHSLSERGIELFRQLVAMLKLMDVELFISGIKPDHAQALRDIEGSGVTFVQSLSF